MGVKGGRDDKKGWADRAVCAGARWCQSHEKGLERKSRGSRALPCARSNPARL